MPIGALFCPQLHVIGEKEKRKGMPDLIKWLIVFLVIFVLLLFFLVPLFRPRQEKAAPRRMIFGY